MKDELKTVNKIVEKSKDMVFDRETRIRELKRIVPQSVVATVKSDEIEGEPTGVYTVFFRDLAAAAKPRQALADGKTVLVTLKEIGGRPDVIKSEIRTPNVEIPETSLEEQQEEVMNLGNDY